MTDCELLEEISGAAGGLAEVAGLSRDLNNRMTSAFDAVCGPDWVDTFDASCNTCKHFERLPFDRKTHLVSIWGFPGQCGKKDGLQVSGWPRGQYCGFENAECYENRRTGKSPKTLQFVGSGGS